MTTTTILKFSSKTRGQTNGGGPLSVRRRTDGSYVDNYTENFEFSLELKFYKKTPVLKLQS